MNIDIAIALASKYGSRKDFHLLLSQKYDPEIIDEFTEIIYDEIITKANQLAELPDAAGWTIYEIRRAIAALILKGKLEVYTDAISQKSFDIFRQRIANEIKPEQIVPMSNWTESIGIQWPQVDEQIARNEVNIDEQKIQISSNIVPEKIMTMETFNGLYSLNKELGKGKFGEVNLYIENATGNRYVGKILKKKKEYDVELKILKQIKAQCSPYLLCIEFSADLGSKWLLMYDYIPDSIDLLTFVKDKNSWKDQITKNLLEGLVKLHQLGIIHKDIKPENILIESKTDAIHYIDYGISCFIDDMKCLRMRIGTLNYFAPEQVFESESTIKSDIWSLGMTLVYALGGVALVTVGQNMIRKRTSPPQTKMDEISSFNGDARYTELLKAMLRVKPSERATAQEALDLFNRLFFD